MDAKKPTEKGPRLPFRNGSRKRGCPGIVVSKLFSPYHSVEYADKTEKARKIGHSTNRRVYVLQRVELILPVVFVW